MIKKIFAAIIVLSLSSTLNAQKPYSIRMADSFMSWYPDSIAVPPRLKSTWDYEQGLMLKAIEKVWHKTANDKYFNYIEHDLQRFIDKDGNIRTYKKSDYNLDNISTGRVVLTLAQQSLGGKEKRYQAAAHNLWEQIEEQPKTNEGGFWHKQRYPYQMWLDGLFMAEPFAAEYSLVFDHPEHFDEIVKQFELIEKHAVDTNTGLIYHGYDESKEQKWADPKTGLSPHFWGRAIGWYAMALVEVLDYLPAEHSGRPKLIAYLNRLAPALVKYQDEKSGVWYQMTALGSKEGNYFEASSSCMFVYALLKGVRKGYLNESYIVPAEKGYQGILKEFVEEEKDGTLSLNNTVSVGGLGGSPYRDGSYEYYLSEPIRKNDLKGVGPFIFASTEMELRKAGFIGAGQKVGLDYYFNHEFRTSLSGEKEQFHYIWTDPFHSGFSWFGEVFEHDGAELAIVADAPSKQNLKDLDVYIIVDPDTKKETASPNFIETNSQKVIKKWVKKGGTLLVMANDSANCEIPHTNQLISQFGISFTDKCMNMVEGTQWEMGLVEIPAGNEIFKNTSNVYIKELVTLNLDDKAVPVLSKGNDIIMAHTAYGKGRVIVIGDPWLYNEYVDGRRIPLKYENHQAAKDLAAWLLKK